jgi:hypothetical protein
MKKALAIALSAILLLTAFPAVALAGNGNGNGNGANLVPSGPHYTLNIVGKKADWNGPGGGGGTIMVPADSSGWSFTAPDGSPIDGIKIEVADGPFEVTDGNAFDGEGAFSIPKGSYELWICMRGKPDPDDYNTTIKGWVYKADEDISLLNTGTFNVSRKWKDATEDLLYVNATAWGYGAHEYVFDLPYDEYFWSLLSHGAKLIKVRWYPK